MWILDRSGVSLSWKNNDFDPKSLVVISYLIAIAWVTSFMHSLVSVGEGIEPIGSMAYYKLLKRL